MPSVLAALCFLIFSSAARAESGRLDDLKKEALNYFLSQYPIPVSLSPDGKKILVKSRWESDFEIFIIDIASQKKIHSRRSKENQLSLTWRPDSQGIVYLAKSSDNRRYRLHHWKFAEEPVSIDQNLMTDTALPPIRFSPNGDKLLLYVGTPFMGGLYILAVDTERSSIPLLVSQAFARDDYGWSPDGRRIAYIPPEGGKVNLQSVPFQKPTPETIALGEKTIVKDLAWSPDGNFLLVTLRRPEDEFYGLGLVDLQTRSLRWTLKRESDIRRPHWLPDGERFIFESNKDGISEIYLADKLNRKPIMISQPNTSHRILGLSKNGRAAYVLSSFLNKPPALTALSLDSTSSKTIFRSAMAAKNKSPFVSPRILRIPSFDGLPIPLMIWEPSSALKKRGNPALLFVHGGPHLQELPEWDARTQWAAQKGLIVAVVNYRGSSGYGQGYEAHNNLRAQAQDILAVQNYLATSLSVSTGNIILVGASYGTKIALEAISLKPGAFRGIVLLSTLDVRSTTGERLPFSSPIFAFHGNEDPILPSPHALQALRERLGNDVFEKDRNRWTVFSEEAHHFHRTDSWADVYAAILSLAN